MFTCIKVLRPPVVKGGLCVRYMNRWDKQCVSGWARTNTTKGITCASMGRAQSNLRMRIGWMHSQGAARDSRSSMYGCA